jgi:hypothetical protein
VSAFPNMIPTVDSLEITRYETLLVLLQVLLPLVPMKGNDCDMRWGKKPDKNVQ